MQQVENCGGEEEATVDVQFTDLPNALIACKVPEDLFDEDGLKVSRKRRSQIAARFFRCRCRCNQWLLDFFQCINFF